MKKLNRKGFTLIELLAVVIILAIIVGITIPAVLTTAKKAREKTFIMAAETAADWFDRQYQVVTTSVEVDGMATLDTNFINACGEEATICNDADGFTFNLKETDENKLKIARDLVSATGIQIRDIDSMHVHINKNTGRTCVTLIASSEGDYYGLVDDNKAQSGTC